MSVYGGRQAINHYRSMGEHAQVTDASPHQLIQMMLDGAAARVAAARGALAAGEVAAKGEFIGKAIGLVEGLRISLDLEQGGQLAGNLSALYEYMGRRLLEANLRNDEAILGEVASLLRELQSGWRELGQGIAGDAARSAAEAVLAAR